MTLAEARTEGLRAAIEQRLHGCWYGPGNPPWYLRLLEPVYAAVSRRRHRRGDGGGGRVPRVVVGNITAGGSGKTPLVAALCGLVQERGWQAGVASTGYGRRGAETVQVRADTDPRVCGDEPLLLARNTGAAVVVARRRTEALAMLEKMAVDVIIADDGLQQPGLRWDITVCVVDGSRGTGNGHLLPAGPLREPLQRLWQVDYVISKGEWAARPTGLASSVIKLRYGTPRSVGGEETASLSVLRRQAGQGRVHAVAGIADPAPFFAMLEAQGFNLSAHRFADHHRYQRRDFDRMGDAAAIIMTEKDAVKCRDFKLPNAWYVPVEVELPAAFRQRFGEHLARLRRSRP